LGPIPNPQSPVILIFDKFITHPSIGLKFI
jgi:hypothetical protein